MNPARHVAFGTVLLVVLVLGVFGCGRPDDHRAASTADETGPSRHPWSRRQPRFIAARLPRATHARWGPQDESVLDVHLHSSEDLAMRGFRWPLLTDDEDGRAALLQAFGAELEKACSDVGARTPSGACRLLLALHASRYARWAPVRDVLRAAFQSEASIQRLLWSVEVSDADRWVCQEAAVTISPPRAAPSAGDTLQVELTHQGFDEETQTLRLTVGDARWTSTWPRDDLEDKGDELGAMGAARARLRATAAGHTRVEVRVTEPTPRLAWGHVATVLDMILASGLREVDLPDVGLHLSLAEPDDLSRPPPASPDDPVVTPVILVVSILVTLLAFAATLLPLRGLRPKRQR